MVLSTVPYRDLAGFFAPLDDPISGPKPPMRRAYIEGSGYYCIHAPVRPRPSTACYPDGIGRLSEINDLSLPGGRLLEQPNCRVEIA